MPLTPLPGAATLTVKVSDFNAMISALAELKPQHDAVHSRVREMSEGRD